MSCEIKTVATVPELEQIQDLFGFSQEKTWLNAVYYALSPTSDLFAIAHGTQVVFLSSRWDNETQHSRYSITWKGHLANPNDIITAVLCLPIIVSSANTQSAPEWTCVALGLSTGFVQFYTDSGLEIYAQQWHNEPVQSIRAQSGKRKNEEIHIYYLTCVCIVQGSHLLQTLRSTKNYLQKAAASFKAEQSPLPEALPCRKWSYGGKSVAINDAVVVGPQRISTFDHLLTASMEGGFYARYKSSPPLNALVIGVGQKPYAGFHWAKEGYMQPVLADVARAVASKIKSALPSWLTGSQPPETDAPPAPVPAEPMTLRFGLCDQQRVGLSVWLAPDNLYAAVTDNLGRVMLIDCFRGIAVRVWKGYRDAQCSFVKVTEKTTKNVSSDRPDRRHALFLVIFAPRRSCIEIWGLQRGQKVAAFTVSKGGQLIYNPHSLMGGGGGGGSKVKYTSNNCVFLDPCDRSLKEIVIPFHCALTDSNSMTAKDLHLLRRIKLCLRSGDGTADQQLEEVRSSCSCLQTYEIRLQCIEMLVKNNKIQPVTLKAALDVFTEPFVNDSDPSLDHSVDQHANVDQDATIQLQRTQLRTISTNYSRLVDFYLYVSPTDRVQPTVAAMAKEEATESTEPVKLNISEIELENLQKFIDLTILERNNAAKTSRVTFNERTKSNEFVDYLSAFNCCVDNDVDCDNWIHLRPEKVNLLASVGGEIYGQFMEKGKQLDEFVDNAKQSRICGEELMRLFLSYWLNKPFSYTRSEDLIIDLTRFTTVLQHICSVDKENVTYEYNAVSCWWQAIRETLLESPHTLMSLIAAMMCRNYAARFRKQSSQDDCSAIAAEEELWETVSQEAAEWSLLIDKLDDVAALGAILTNSRPADVDAVLPIINYEIPDVSLKAIVSGGKGIVSELVAKWVLSLGVDPIVLLEPSTVPSTSIEETNVVSVDEQTIENTSFLHYVRILRDHFPFSLQSGIVIVHMTWEYMCAWSKKMQQLDYFKAALKCLASIRPADYAIKHGLCCMIWNAHLKIPLEATRKLINKTGRLPKEKLCLQDIGVSDSLVPEMLEHCTTFLEHFNDSIENEKMDLRYEELLQEGPVSLALLALQQNIAIAETVQLHIQLNRVLYMIAALNIKYAKPVQCVFDAMSNQTFFTEINRALPYVLPQPDMVLQSKRTEFLCLAITATMDFIREDLECVFLNEHIEWMDRIEALSNIWQLDNDQLKKHQIVELYAYGWDEYAEEQLESVLDTQPLGGLLLKIAGRRLNIFTKNTPNSYAQVASFGPLVTDYLDTIHNSSNHLIHRGSDDISIDKLIGLTGKAFKCLAHKDSKELRVAGQMFDACHHLKELM